MKLLNKILLAIAFISAANTASANSLPPFSNQEIKQYADSLLKRDLTNTAKKYYLELAKRGDKINGNWGLALVNIKESNESEAIKKIDFLLQQKNINKLVLDELKAKLLLNLAEKAIYAQQTAEAESYLNEYLKNYNFSYSNLKPRFVHLRNLLSNNRLNQNIKVGVILPLSGKLESYGQQIKNALMVSLYDNKLNNITLQFQDNKSTQEGSIQAATNLTSQGVNLVIGPLLRDNVLAANTVLGITQTPIFTFSNDKSVGGANIFVNNINIEQEAAEITRFAFDNGNYKIACLTPDNLAGQMQQASFINTVDKFGANINKCSSFSLSNTDINKNMKVILDINKKEKIRKAALTKLEKEFERLGFAMSDEKIKQMEELKITDNSYEVDFNAIFIPAPAKIIPVIAPQLAYYDTDFSNGVLFLGSSAWDNNSILKNRGEHLHFSRFLSLKTNEFNLFEKRYQQMHQQTPNLLAGFAYDVLLIANQIDFSKNFYTQIHQESGFKVLTGNVKFNNYNIPDRLYGINKISRRAIRPVKHVSHVRPVEIPEDLSLEKAKSFGNWFKF